MLNDELSKPTILHDIPDEITHAVVVGEQAILCQTTRKALLLLDAQSGQYSRVSEETSPAGALKIEALACHASQQCILSCFRLHVCVPGPLDR